MVDATPETRAQIRREVLVLTLLGLLPIVPYLAVILWKGVRAASTWSPTSRR